MNSGSSSSERLVRRRQSAPARKRAERGLDRRDDGQALTRRRDDRLLHQRRGLVDARRQVGDQAIDLLSLRGGERRGLRGFLGDGVGLGDERTDLLAHRRDGLLRGRQRRLRLLDRLLRLLRATLAATTITPIWIERHDQRRGGDDAEEHEVPIGHNVSGVPGACGGFALRAWL